MKAFMLFAGGGPLVILTSHNDITEPALLKKFEAKGITKFIAYELPVSVTKERYGGHFNVVMHDLHESDDLRVLDYSGQRAFNLIRLSELGPAIHHDPDVSDREAA